MAEEHPELERFLDQAAETLAQHLDVSALLALFAPQRFLPEHEKSVFSAPLPPLGQHIAIAQDKAFAFIYPLILAGWRHLGVEVSFFSPLQDEEPSPHADAVFLPGGYPELYAEQLSTNRRFLNALGAVQKKGGCIYGECGGFMVLGEFLTDEKGKKHPMAKLLPVCTTFAKRALTLGYRDVTALTDTPLGSRGRSYRGHEFHFAQITSQEEGNALFHCRDARGNALGPMGLVHGRVMGSFVHLIDTQEPKHRSNQDVC